MLKEIGDKKDIAEVESAKCPTLFILFSNYEIEEKLKAENKGHRDRHKRQKSFMTSFSYTDHDDGIVVCVLLSLFHISVFFS